MATPYAAHYNPHITPQSEAMCPDQVMNNAGGFVWNVSPWMRLDRFLTLGCQGGVYYVEEKPLTRENAKAIEALILEDGVRVVERTAEISAGGKAYKNDPALFVLALAMAAGDAETKAAVERVLPQVARTASFLFTFVDYINTLRGWGRSVKRMVGNWYQQRPADDLAYQLVKYQQRHGWSHRDVLRLAKPVPIDDAHGALYAYATHKPYKNVRAIPRLLPAVAAVQMPEASVDHVASVIRRERLPRECLPTELLREPKVWEALLEKMPMTALIRNLATLTRIGLLQPMGEWTTEVARRITDPASLQSTRIHPIQVLAALLTYSSGKSARGSSAWEPLAQITDALDRAFYLAFANVEPANRSTMLALDVSPSMRSPDVMNVPGLSPHVACAALALITAATEPQTCFTAFSGNMIPLAISPRQRLDNVLSTVDHLEMSATDCALPMLYALDKGLSVETFVIFTDSETWCGDIHPKQALDLYRNRTGIRAKLITVACTATDFTIADPNDAGMLDVCGFSTDTPALIAQFSRA